MQQPSPSFKKLFLSFFKLGITAFGGPAMVAYIKKLVVEREGWLDDQTFKNGVAFCQAIPGATAMQTTAYVGLTLKGYRGAAASFIGFGLPAFILMTILSALYLRFYQLPIIVSAFSGLKVIIVAIVGNAAIVFAKSTLKSWRKSFIAASASILFLVGIHPIGVILLAAILGFLLIPRNLTLSSPPAHNIWKSPLKKGLLLILGFILSGYLLLFYFRPLLFQLAMIMMRIDLFAFGGGFASLPLMYHDIVEIKGWLDGATFMDGISLGQITPGPIVITATFIGYILNGLIGSLTATFSIFLPSFLMVVFLSPYFERLRNLPWFNRITSGILCSFVGLLFAVAIRFGFNVKWDLFYILLAGAALVALLKKVDIIWIISIGIIISFLARI